MGTTRLAVRVGYQLLDLFWSLLEILTSIALSVLLLPLFAVVWLCNEVARLVVRGLLLYEYLKTGRSERTRLISNGVDGIWSFQKQGNSRNVLIVYVYSRPIDLADFRSKYLHRIVAQPEYAKLRKIFVKRYGYFCWKEPEAAAFDIARHVKNVSVSAPGPDVDPEVPVTESQLNAVILPALAKDMDESKPQWEELIIPDFRYDSEAADADAGGPPRRSARIYRSHHAYMDGGSTLMLCANMYSPDDASSEVHAEPVTATTPRTYCTAPTFPYMVNPLAPPRAVPAWKTALYKFNCALLGLTTVGKILYEASQIRSRFLTPGPYSGRQIFSISRTVKLSTLKEIKEVTHTSLPTILSSVIGASVQRLDQRMGGDESPTPNSIPIGLVGAILPYPNHRPCNRFTVVNFRVSTAGRRTRLENLKATQRSMSALATSPNGYINYVLFRIFGKCPSWVLHFMMRKGCTPIIYSNTPWAMERVKLWGTPVENVFGWMPLLTTAGIGILTVSYHDTLKFCVIADDGCVSEKEATYLTEELNAQVQELAEECRRQRAKNSAVLGGGGGVTGSGGVNGPLIV